METELIFIGLSERIVRIDGSGIAFRTSFVKCDFYNVLVAAVSHCML